MKRNNSNMIGKIFLLLFVAVCAKHHMMPGGVADMPLANFKNDSLGQKALNFAVVDHNKRSNSLFHDALLKVVRVQTQVVSGIRYIFTLDMVKTTCRKSNIESTCLNQSVSGNPKLQRRILTNMKVLSKTELQIAEEVLQKHLPKSFKVYGFLHAMNRNKPTTLEVVVDTWPDFKVIICRPDPKNKCSSEFMKKVTYFSLDDQILWKILTEENAVDWSTYFLIGGFDSSHASMLKEVSSLREVKNKCLSLVHLLYLPVCDGLITPVIDSELKSRISSLNLSHVDLVNKTWKFGGNEQGHANITKLISNFPTCCINDDQGRPMSWILLYDYCALGMLYTVPEHRGKGYAKIMIYTMARRIHAQGYPVYCFVEEDNDVSYRLFKSMGFIDDPSYRALWFEFNV